MEAFVNQMAQFQHDLEIRIASSLKVNTDLPARVGVNMAVQLSRQIGEAVTTMSTIEVDKIIRKAL
jgi:hypothetical protein